jgi:glycerol kinase
VEQNPEEIRDNALAAIDQVLQKTGIDDVSIPSRILALTISNQRETILAWDGRTGSPVCNAITWQCGRATSICKKMEAEGYAEFVRKRTGLRLSPYFSAAKASWIMENVEAAGRLARSGHFRLGTVDSWLIWHLTGGETHATDCSNASRTQLYNLRERTWDPEILDLFGIPPDALPRVLGSDERFGKVVRSGNPLQDKLAGLPIAGVMGDSHAALFGQNCFSPGMTKATYGTGSSIMMHTGEEPVDPGDSLVASVAWGRAGKVEYVLEGNINCTGATLQWLADDLELIGHPRESGSLAASVPDTGGVYLVPAFTGLGAPYWDPDARASLTGMSRSTRKAHLVRAAEESIAYQIKDVVDLMATVSGQPLRELRVDGGPTRDTFLMQFQSDMLGIPVACAGIEELSAFGSCLMGGLSIGLWSGLEEIASLRKTGPVYRPSLSPENRSVLYRGWQEAVRRTLSIPSEPADENRSAST